MTEMVGGPRPSRAMARLKSVVRALLPRRIREARARAAEMRQHEKYSNLPVDEVFSEIYRNNEWGGASGGYYSGDGSHDPEIVTPYVEAVSEFLSAFPGKPVLVDLGSGDFNVGVHFVGAVSRYIACDIVAELQAHNRKRYSFDNVEFRHLNAVTDQLPAGDIVVVRQVLQHLSNDQIRSVLAKLHQYPSWIITEHLPSASGFSPNIDLSAGCGIRVLKKSGVVLTAPPFGVPLYRRRFLCEVAVHDGVIRTDLFERNG